MKVADGYASDWGYVAIDDIVTITHPGKPFSLPYVCVLRHGHHIREFELLRSPLDDEVGSELLILDNRGDCSLEDLFEVIVTYRRNFPSWHFNRYGSNSVFPECN